MQILPYSTSHYIHCHIPQHRTPHRTSCITPHWPHFTAPHHTPLRCAYTHHIPYHTTFIATFHSTALHTAHLASPHSTSGHIPYHTTFIATFHSTALHTAHLASLRIDHIFTAPHHTPSRCAYTHQTAHHTSLSTSHNSVSHHSTTFCIIPYVVSLHLKALDTPSTTFCITVFHITQFTSYKASHHTIPQHISHLVTTMDIKHHKTTSHTAPLPHCT